MKTNLVKIAWACLALLLPFTASAQSGYEIYKSNGEKLSLSYTEVDSIVFRADLAAYTDMVSEVKTTNQTISYQINVAEGETYSHTYIEGWFFDYLMETAKENEGEEFSADVVVLNLLADYGHQCTGPQRATWTAGEENIARNDVVRLVGGKDYYILASHYDPEAANWLGKPFVKKVSLDAAGHSAAAVQVAADEITPTSLKVTLTPDEDVNFYYYGFYPKLQYDENLSQNGQEWMENFVYEYGHTGCGTYQDNWSVDPECPYVLAVFGADKHGDTFFHCSEFTTPAVKEELKVQMAAYERPNENHFAYDCMKIDVDAQTLKNMDAEAAMEIFMPKATLDETLAMMGFTMDMLRQAPEYVAYFGATPLPEEEAAALLTEQAYTTLRTDLEPETEYAYLLLIPNGDQYVLGEAYAKTEAKPAAEVATEAYKGYLGNWIVRGKSTMDYASEDQYQIRIEEDIVNRSLKIYGWGHSEYVKDLGITARYDKDSERIFIDGNQDFGTVTIDGVVYNIKFCGMMMSAGELAPVVYDGVIYEGNRLDSHLSMFPNFMNGYEFQSMGFFAEKDGVYYALPGDEYCLYSLLIDRN